MDQVECSSESERLEDCSYVSPTYGNCKDNFVVVECAGSVNLTLNMNGQMDKCAGVVQFSTTQIGVVGICNSGWDEEKANSACKELGCGESHYISKSDIFQGQPSSHSGHLQCVMGKDNTKFLWQCMKWPYNDTCSEYTSVICTKHRRFRLQNGSNLCSGSLQEYNVATRSWVSLQQIDVAPESICAQMNCGAIGKITHENTNPSIHLTCQDVVKLRNFTSPCFGPVVVVVNGSDRGVCYSDNLSHNLGKVVCRELKCGEVFGVKQDRWTENGWLSNVECQGDEESLFHCLAKHQITKCQSATVICSDSLEVRLKDGFGRCSGRVEVKLEGSWKSLSTKDWTNMNSDMVCKHLDCGEASDLTQKLFIEGKQVRTDWMVRCKSSSAKLHECLQKSNKNQNIFAKEITKEIICQKEELVFIEGDRPCQGRVRKLSFERTNISREKQVELNNETAPRFCEEMGCGSKGFFENTTNQPIVKCAGSVSVKLSNPNKERCWGTVEVCRDNRCGGVCRNTWRTTESEKICGNLGCGDPVKTLYPIEMKSLPVTVHSVYCLGEMKNLSMCKFVPNKDSSCMDQSSLICKDSIKVELVDPRDKCAGNVKLFYGGIMMPVCKDSLDEGLQNAICRELNCGQAESVGGARYGLSQTEGLSGIKCESNPDSVAKCNLNDLEKKDCVAGYLKCSGWTRLFLYKKGDACSGPVHALSSRGEKTISVKLVSSQGWTKKEGQVLCEYLQCGNYKSHTMKDSIEDSEWWNKTYNCSGTTNIWKCERDDQKIIERKQLNIKCDGKHPNVTLSGLSTGDMLINEEHVCAVYVSLEKEVLFSQLCNNLGFGNVIHDWTRPIARNGWYFSCIGHETFLWQCYSWKGTCNHTTSMACQKSVKFNTTEKCGGFLGVQFRNKWESVCGNISESDNEEVCKALDCKKGPALDEKQFAEMMANDIQVTVTCPEKYQNINQCVQLLQKEKNQKCQNGRAKITCEGQVKKTQVNVGLIVGVLLGILGLLGVISQRNRLLSALRRYRKKDAKDKTLNANEMNDMETEDRDSEENVSLFEKDDYEEVDAITKRKGEDDADDKSAGSAGTEYDDIEEQAHDVSHSQTHDEDDPDPPLLPKRPETLLGTALKFKPPHCVCVCVFCFCAHERISVTFADEVTYEVEIEGEQDYDDAIPIEALANENAGTPTADPPAQADVIMDAETNANIEVVEVDVHA
ncbi:scavenger receptor cysteine-rich type 1 protein M130 [Triplophysa dalaica]|uniref:scavenger receptor cysteine-rich type 1 protein M130 n=1 Tax=Triplophysa dalaica TaxID=1582913 RepID=UPI0024DFF4A2|nr:scavenger receptor cysteine-rich type 1 protein M130 [Triplophysa dalaica]